MRLESGLESNLEMLGNSQEFESSDYFHLRKSSSKKILGRSIFSSSERMLLKALGESVRLKHSKTFQNFLKVSRRDSRGLHYRWRSQTTFSRSRCKANRMETLSIEESIYISIEGECTERMGTNRTECLAN